VIAGQMAFAVADRELAIGKAPNHAGGGNDDKCGHTPSFIKQTITSTQIADRNANTGLSKTATATTTNQPQFGRLSML
jgi:hypothetical protein